MKLEEVQEYNSIQGEMRWQRKHSSQELLDRTVLI